VYIAGRISNTAVYWKNGVSTNAFTAGPIQNALGIVLSENNLYVVGYRGNQAQYRFNNEVIAVTENIHSSATDIFIR